MAQESIGSVIDEYRHQVIDDFVAEHVPEHAYPEQWDTAGLNKAINDTLNLELPIVDWAKEEGIADEELKARIIKAADERAVEGGGQGVVERSAMAQRSQYELVEEGAIARRQGLDVGPGQPLGEPRASPLGALIIARFDARTFMPLSEVSRMASPVTVRHP